MVRPEPIRSYRFTGIGCCVELAGVSPASVSTGAPSSRFRAWGEIVTSERNVESPTAAVWSSARGAMLRAECVSVNLAAP
jgi:hypothetical protein